MNLWIHSYTKYPVVKIRKITARLLNGHITTATDIQFQRVWHALDRICERLTRNDLSFLMSVWYSVRLRNQIRHFQTDVKVRAFTVSASIKFINIISPWSQHFHRKYHAQLINYGLLDIKAPTFCVFLVLILQLSKKTIMLLRIHQPRKKLKQNRKLVEKAELQDEVIKTRFMEITFFGKIERTSIEPLKSDLPEKNNQFRLKLWQIGKKQAVVVTGTIFTIISLERRKSNNQLCLVLSFI